MNNRRISAIAPAKVILFGEHAINRGQPAIAASIGLYARCEARLGVRGIRFRAGERTETSARDEVLRFGKEMDACRTAGNFDSIRQAAAADYFAPQKYILTAMFGEDLPEGLSLEWTSDVPPSSGLGSGGCAFTAMVTALDAFRPVARSLHERAAWAHQGDIVAHGGVASALDSQTSLLGGVIRFAGQGLAEPVSCAPGLCLVVGNTGIIAATSEVNARVRNWLDERPRHRLPYFQTIGTLTRAAIPALERGDWEELGRLFNLNQLVLEKIGVGCPAADRLIEAALSAGAFGAKISGSGGGGIVIALASPDRAESIASAMNAAGGTALIPRVAVPGVRVLDE